MNIVVLEGSPNTHGSSNMLADAFIKGAQEKGHTVEVFDLPKMNIHPCMGCVRCGYEGPCVQHDDVIQVRRSLLSSDMVVFVTPLYYYGMSAQLKTMIDRTLPRYTEIRDKDVYFIATAAAGRRSMERTMDALRGFTDCLPGAVVKGEIYGEGVYQKGEVENTPAYTEAFEAGKAVR